MYFYFFLISVLFSGLSLIALHFCRNFFLLLVYVIFLAAGSKLIKRYGSTSSGNFNTKVPAATIKSWPTDSYGN